MEDQYEYHVVEVRTNKFNQEHVLEQFTREGWELVTTQPLGWGGITTQYTWKRRKQAGNTSPHPIPKPWIQTWPAALLFVGVPGVLFILWFIVTCARGGC